MANDYESALGIWHHKIGDIEHKIKPREGDNLRIARTLQSGTKSGLDWMCDQFNKHYFDMVTREDQLSEQDKLRLKLWIELNQNQIQKDLLIKFGWRTKEQQDKLDNLGDESIKKSIGV